MCVTNGGYTGVTTALHHGVPLVQAGSTEEKAEIGRRVAWSGVGVRIRWHAPGRPPGPGGRASGARATRHTGAGAAGWARRCAATTPAREGAELLERLAGDAASRSPTPVTARRTWRR